MSEPEHARFELLTFCPNRISPEYKPNEIELRADSLKNVSADLRAKNTAVNNSTVSLSNSRRDRNAIFYGEPNKAVKPDVKSVFGAASPQYKPISGLAFKNMGK